MSFDLSKVLVIGISSRALFDLEEENQLFETAGPQAYTECQLQRIDAHPLPGVGFRIVKNLLDLNQYGERHVEVIVLSRNNAAASLRITKAIEHYGLDITRSAWTGGESLVRYLRPYQVDLFLSANHEDVQAAINAGFAAARVYVPHNGHHPSNGSTQLRIAFDGDAVLFSEESERIFQEQGLDAFIQHERENALKPLPEGPFAPLLRTIARIQASFPPENSPIHTALITARGSIATERVIRTLAAWQVRVDEVHALGGVSKDAILKAFEADIFFDDQDTHCRAASQVVPTAIVPVREQADWIG